MIKLTSAIGNFFFEDDVLLSHAKLIRDTVMKQYLMPRRGTPVLSDEDSCYEFMKSHPSRIICDIPFKMEIIKERASSRPIVDDFDDDLAA